MVRYLWSESDFCATNAMGNVGSGAEESRLLSKVCAIVQSKAILWIMKCLSSMGGMWFELSVISFGTFPLSTLCTLVGEMRSGRSCQGAVLYSGHCFLGSMCWWVWVTRKWLSHLWGLEDEDLVFLLLERATPPGCSCLSICLSARKPFCLVVASLPFGSSCWWGWHCLRGTHCTL